MLEKRFLDSHFKNSSVQDYGFVCMPEVFGEKAIITPTENDHFYTKTTQSLGAKPKEVMAFVHYILKCGAYLDILEENIFFSPNNPAAETIEAQSKVATTIRRRTSIKVNANRKRQGLPVGRQQSKNNTYRLDKNADNIVKALADGESKTSLAARLDVTRVTLNRWLKTHNHMPKYVGSPSQQAVAKKKTT